jgi:hypothetical protein
MEISQQQTIDVLREWQRKKWIIQGGMIDSLDNNAAIFGCIEESDDHSVRIDARTFAQKAKNIGIIIRLNNAAFSFGDWPETPPKYEGDLQFSYKAFLIITFTNGTRCELYATNL